MKAPQRVRAIASLYELDPLSNFNNIFKKPKGPTPSARRAARARRARCDEAAKKKQAKTKTSRIAAKVVATRKKAAKIPTCKKYAKVSGRKVASNKKITRKVNAPRKTALDEAKTVVRAATPKRATSSSSNRTRASPSEAKTQFQWEFYVPPAPAKASAFVKRIINSRPRWRSFDEALSDNIERSYLAWQSERVTSPKKAYEQTPSSLRESEDPYRFIHKTENPDNPNIRIIQGTALRYAIDFGAMLQWYVGFPSSEKKIRRVQKQSR